MSATAPPLSTMVTFTLAKVAKGTRLRLVHAGFELAEERQRLSDHERRLEEGPPHARQHRRRADRRDQAALTHITGDNT